jgi:tRNA(Ile2) C34 agmatinyltransferase TiaS
MTACRDSIIPGSLRTEVTTLTETLVTLRCGRCGSEFDARAECKTTRCKRCGRVCRLDTATELAPNVTPIRRGERGAA